MGNMMGPGVGTTTSKKSKKKKKKKKRRSDDSDSDEESSDEESSEEESSDEESSEEESSDEESSDSDSEDKTDEDKTDKEKDDKKEEIVKKIDDEINKIKIDFDINFDNWPGGFQITNMTDNTININNIVNIPQDIKKQVDTKKDIVNGNAEQENKDKAKDELNKILNYLK